MLGRGAEADEAVPDVRDTRPAAGGRHLQHGAVPLPDQHRRAAHDDPVDGATYVAMATMRNHVGRAVALSTVARVDTVKVNCTVNIGRNGLKRAVVEFGPGLWLERSGRATVEPERFTLIVVHFLVIPEFKLG